MRKGTQVLAWVIIILCILGIVLSIAEIGGSWILNQRVSEGITSLFAAVQSIIQQIGAALSRVDAELQAVINGINTVQENAVQLGESVEENSPIIARLSGLVDEDLGPKINGVRESLRSIRDSAVAINNTLIAFNMLPGIELPTLTDELQEASDRLDELSLAVQQERAAISEFRTGVIEGAVGRFIARTDTLLDRVTSIRTDVNSYQAQIAALQSGVETLQTNVLSWISWTTVGITLLVLWNILGQIALLLIAWVYLKTGKMIWQYGLVKRQPGEALEGSS